MRNILKSLLVTLIMILPVFSSCQKDEVSEDTSKSSNLIGTWELKETHEWGIFLSQLIFKSNFTGTNYRSETFYDESVGENLFIKSEFTWSVTGNLLTILYNGENFEYSISGNCLTSITKKVVFLKK